MRAPIGIAGMLAILILAGCGQQEAPLLPQKGPDGLWGYAGEDGKFLIAPRFDYAAYFSEGLAAVCIRPSTRLPAPSDRKCGFIDETGEYVIPTVYSNVRDFEDGLAGVQSNNKWMFIDRDGQRRITTLFDVAPAMPPLETIAGIRFDWRRYGDRDVGLFQFHDGRALVRVVDKIGVIDTTGRFVANPQFDWAFPFVNGLAAVEKGEQWGFIDKYGNTIVTPRFDLVTSFEHGQAAVSLDGRWGLIDGTGKYVLPPIYKSINPYKETAVAAETFDGKTEIIERPTHALEPQPTRPAGRLELRCAALLSSLTPLDGDSSEDQQTITARATLMAAAYADVIEATSASRPSNKDVADSITAERRLLPISGLESLVQLYGECQRIRNESFPSAELSPLTPERRQRLEAMILDALSRTEQSTRLQTAAPP